MGFIHLVWPLWVTCALAFSFGGHKADKMGTLHPAARSNVSPLERLREGSQLATIYAAALNELQELEAEPLCHRVAARLLVNNCQLLEGKDDATVLTDSGRQIRDFVDSYAASLAICDLERGAFEIPSSCARFREPVLVQLQLQDEPRLHVSSGEIDSCLTGLATSNSAWATWVSYRHKALRFCEAARVDQEKAQNILLYQRLTKVMAKLADGVEIELQKQLERQKEVEKQMSLLGLRTRETGELLGQLAPQVDRIQAGLSGLEEYLSNGLDDALRNSMNSVKAGHDAAESLRQLLNLLVSTVTESNSQVVKVQEQSLERVSRKTNEELDVLVTAVASVVASSVSLQNQVELSRSQAEQLARQQVSLERGMQRLAVQSKQLSVKHNTHAFQLDEATNMTGSLLKSLEEASSSAASLGADTWSRWPFFVCPVVTLLLGSYGLPPSLLRNLTLLGLGELLGLTMSVASHIDGLPLVSFSSGFLNGTMPLYFI